MEVLIDTNIIMAPFNFKVDVFGELRILGFNEFLTIDLVIKELEDLLRKGGKPSKAAKLGLEIADKNKLEIINTNGSNADEEILKTAEEKQIPVCTTDRPLIKKLKLKKIKIITLRQKKMLIMA